jgi:hypothetical protein
MFRIDAIWVKSSRSGMAIEFNRIYETCIRPAVDAEGGICVRADEEEEVGGFILKPTFSRLLHSELVIADLTTANPNVLYEVGIRHAARSRHTILIIWNQETAPFDLGFSCPIKYELDTRGFLTAESAVQLTNQLRERIRKAFNATAEVDSPLFLFLDDFPGLNLEKVERAPELFLSYARADAEMVDPIYNKLRDNGYAPWMDTKNILPGERWEKKISQAIKNADFFLAFLSASQPARPRGSV